MSLPLVIVNPASADGATREVWPKFASDLRTHFGPFTVVLTEGVGHGRLLAAEAAKQGAKLIIACGGDGTISEVANGILDSNKETELGILPGGTGSDFRRSLHMPTNTAATVQTTLAASPIEVHIQLDDEPERRLRVAEFCVANARYYGGGMKIAPDAKLDDGLFDCINIGDAGAFRILAN